LFEQLKKAGHPIWYVKIHGGGVFQRVGLPDFILCLAGHFAVLELKRDMHKDGARPAQERQLRWIERAGGTAWVEDDLEVIRAKVLARLAGPERA
jgi:hypothetical protein